MSAAENALELFDRAWRPFVMDKGSKFPPPTGVTGYKGRNVDRATLAKAPDGSNLALRMTTDVAGFDIDAHDGKPGLATLADLETRLGPLPPTWHTHSSRDDGSRIRFYRVPPGTHLVSALPGIELIQWFHRYAMVAPSVHPEGRRYAWFDEQADEPVDLPPEVGDLPELPWAWINELSTERAGNGSTSVTPDEVAAWFDEHTEARHPAGLKGLATYLANVAAKGIARHDTLKRGAVMAALEVSAGYYPALDAEAVLTDWWAEAFKGTTGRTPDDGEFGRLIVWAIGYAKNNPAEVDEKRAKLNTDDGNTDDDAPTRKAPPARDALVDIAEAHYVIGRLDDERTYLVPHDGPNVALLRGDAKADLARRYRALTGKTAGRSPLDEAWMTIEGIAHEAPKESLPLRVGSTANGSPVIDLADTTGRAIVASSEGWAIVDRSPITFRRSKAMLPLGEPVPGGTVDELFGLLNVDPGNRALFAAWLTSALFDWLPHPAPVLTGTQGTTKSSTARGMTKLIDPCLAATQKPPKSDDEWAQTCAARWMVAIDNVSNVAEWWSDALCRTITGDGWLRRALYTDDDVVATSWRRCIILNGITLGQTLRPDLAERLVLFELQRPTEWLTEREVDERLDDMRPRVLGALLDLAVGILAAWPTVEVVRDLRMADFATFLAAHDTVTGLDALGSYRQQLDTIFDEALESDPVAMAVIEMMEHRDQWNGTARQLLADLVAPLNPPPDWPANARQMSNAMSRSAAMLHKVGIVWRLGRKSKAGRVATITHTAVAARQGDEGDEGDDDSPLLCLDVREGENSHGDPHEPKETRTQQRGNVVTHVTHVTPPPAEATNGEPLELTAAEIAVRSHRPTADREAF